MLYILCLLFDGQPFNFVDFCHDSTNLEQALLVLAAPKVDISLSVNEMKKLVRLLNALQALTYTTIIGSMVVTDICSKSASRANLSMTWSTLLYC